ncbi:hypothetical protein KP509_09G050400 [Ceratopteris richardii]|uniref:Amidase domain-containing protein n=1 Tax=Ceratopteris richardii TaxID=49495 RepID=A0A8T2U4K5_CERRI|nr:hypothetical protein KP509_09G050400 [Ceratopteris richardii]
MSMRGRSFSTQAGSDSSSISSRGVGSVESGAASPSGSGNESDATSSWFSYIMTPPNGLWVLLGLGIAGAFIYTRSRRKQLRKDIRAFIKYLELLPPPTSSPAAPLPLSGLKFAVQDIFDIKGEVTGFGSPDWERTHQAATCTASSIMDLVQAGAICIGKTCMDELGISSNGQNRHTGTPVNPVEMSYVPGGASSGSAVAVASDLVDFALGIDSSGDVRIPAAYCGVLGFRPSHGNVPCSGAISVSPCLDTVGWFSREPRILQNVGKILLKNHSSDVKRPKRVFIADDCFNLAASKEIRERQISIVSKTIEKEYGIKVSRMKLGEHFASKIPSLKMSLVCFRVDGESGKAERGASALRFVRDAFLVLHGHEFKMNHEEWIQSAKMSGGISVHLKRALEMNSDLVAESMKLRNEARIAFNELLMTDGLLVIPTIPTPPPALHEKDPVDSDSDDCVTILSCLASMSGCCQVSIPLAKYDGCPTAVSLIARHGADHFLLEVVSKIFSGLQNEPEVLANGFNHEEVKPVRRPDSAEAAKEKGNAAFKKKDYKVALRCYTEAIQWDEENPTYYSNRAAAYLALYNFHQAEADCCKALEIDKKNVKALLRRATAREFLGFYKDADEDFRQALVLEPTNRTASDGIRRLKKLILD